MGGTARELLERLELSESDRAALVDRISALDSSGAAEAAAQATAPASAVSASASVSGKALFAPHLPLEQILRLVRAGRLLQGTFLQSRENYLEGNVTVDNFVEKVPSLLFCD